MKDIGKASKPNQEDARIFVSLPASFPSQWVGLIHRRALDLGLSAFVYHGIPQSPFQQINNAEYEARADMYLAKLVFAALVFTGAAEFDGIWIGKYVPKIKAYGIKVHLALVGGDVTDFDNNRNAMNIPFDATVSHFPTAEEWLAFFTAEILRSAAHFRQNPTSK